MPSQNMLIVPEALFTSACIFWFGIFADSDTPDPTGRLLLLWLNGAIMIGTFIWAIIQSIQINDRYHYRWIRVTIYCVLILLALIICNTDWTRFAVLVALVLYIIVSKRKLRNRESLLKEGHPQLDS